MPPPLDRDEDQPVLKEPKNTLKKHLTEDCGLSIIDEHIEEEDLLTIEESDMLTNFPADEHPSWNIGTASDWDCPTDQWYDQAHYDRVIVTAATPDKDKAEAILLHRCTQLGCRRVSDMYRSGKYWCVRVRDLEG